MDYIVMTMYYIVCSTYTHYIIIIKGISTTIGIRADDRILYPLDLVNIACFFYPKHHFITPPNEFEQFYDTEL